MTKISNTKKYAAHWLRYNGFNNEDIAKEIKVAASDIKEIFEEHEKNVSDSKSKNLMITHTAGKKVNSVAIMTKEASELIDAARNNITTTREQKGIFRPKQK